MFTGLQLLPKVPIFQFLLTGLPDQLVADFSFSLNGYPDFLISWVLGTFLFRLQIRTTRPTDC